MRIAIVSETWLPQINGVSRTLNELTLFLDGCGDDLLLMIPRYRPPVASSASCQISSFAGTRLPFYPEIRLPLARPASIRKQLKTFAPDLVHIATEGPLGWAALRAARSLSLPVATSYHTHFAPYLSAYRLGMLTEAAWAYLRWFHNRTDLTLCPTPSARQQLLTKGFRNVDVWSRGVDNRRFDPAHRDPLLRKKLGIASEETVLLYVGRLAAEKNLAMLIDAYRLLKGPKRLLLVGDGPLRAELERQAIPGVLFAGYRHGAELARFYASADIFAFPSLTETFGNVVLEAMASGLATVGFAVQGPGDQIVDGETGLLVATIDAETLATRLQELVDERPLRRRLGNAARACAVGRSWDEINRQVRMHYLRLCTTRAREPERTTENLENESC
ncbi:MAG TPA: glycosyltransferase family 1 protein [Desulfuromonadales bacterium]|nr:glycosyltransferase family 1 protein [Desulfuromonadales bacterium]